MRSIIEYFCPLCIAPIVNAIGGETGNARLTKETKKEKSHTTRNIFIGVGIALVIFAFIFLIYNRNRLTSSFSPRSSCGCGV